MASGQARAGGTLVRDAAAEDSTRVGTFG